MPREPTITGSLNDGRGVTILEGHFDLAEPQAAMVLLGMLPSNVQLYGGGALPRQRPIVRVSLQIDERQEKAHVAVVAALPFYAAHSYAILSDHFESAAKRHRRRAAVRCQKRSLRTVWASFNVRKIP